MESIRVQEVMGKDGELRITGLPYKQGEKVEVTITTHTPPKGFTAKELFQSGLIGMWEDREDIGDSVQYARRQREEAERRG